jgi:hypothetical protein
MHTIKSGLNVRNPCHYSVQLICFLLSTNTNIKMCKTAVLPIVLCEVTWIEVVQEQGAEENVFTQEGGSDSGMKKVVLSGAL